MGEAIAIAASTKDDIVDSTVSLYARIGGAAAVDAAVDKFYGKVLADPVVAPLFANTNMAKQRMMQKNFLTMAFGGPNKYTGKNMKQAHAGLGITETHFGAIAGHLSATLKELGVPNKEHDEAMVIAASTKDDIVDSTVSLYERIGGADAVDAAIDKFYGKVLADRCVAPLFANTNMAKQRIMQKNFLTMAFGGPKKYTGKTMKQAHAGLGITETHFGAIAGHLSATLKELGVPDKEHDEAIAIAASTKDDIVDSTSTTWARLQCCLSLLCALELFRASSLGFAP